MYAAQGNLEQLFDHPDLSNYFSTRLTDRDTLTLLATATSEKHKYIHHHYLAALIEFFRRNPPPNAEEVMLIIQALYDACPEPSQTLNNVFIQLLKNAMKDCIHYLNKHAEMATKALEQGYLLDDTLCDYGPKYFVKQINQHKNFKEQYDTIQCQNPFDQLNSLNLMAQQDWKNRSKPVFMHTGGEVKVISVKDNPNYINYIEKQQHSILIHRLRAIIETLSIAPNFAAYIIFDQSVASTQASFKDYLLGKVNNLAMHSDTFSRRFRGLVGIVTAILHFQNGNLTKVRFDNFIQRLQSAAKIYKDQQGETHAYNAMQDVYIARIGHTWPIAQLQDNQAINNYLAAIHDGGDLDSGNLACQISLILNTDSVNACFQAHFTILDHDLLSYLENKIKSNKSINANPYKHLHDVLNLLLLLTGTKDASFESRLIEHCAAMGSTGMKKYLSRRLVNVDMSYQHRDRYAPAIRQQTLVDKLTAANSVGREQLFAQLHSNTYPFAMFDWMTVLQSNKLTALPFYQDYVNYLRQLDPYFPEFYRLETELYPNLVSLYKRLSDDDNKAVFFEETATVFWTLFENLLGLKPSSLRVKHYKMNNESHIQQLSIQQMRTCFRGHLLPKAPESVTLEPITFNFMDVDHQNVINVQQRRNVMQALATMQHTDFLSKIDYLLILLVNWPAYDYAFEARFESVLMSKISHLIVNIELELTEQQRKTLYDVLASVIQSPAIKHLFNHYPIIRDACQPAFGRYVNLYFSENCGFICYTNSLDGLKLSLRYFLDMLDSDVKTRDLMPPRDYTLTIQNLLKNLSIELVDNVELQQQIADDNKCLHLLGELLLRVNVDNSERKEDYAALINIRSLRNSTTSDHHFSRVLETLAEQNSTRFKSTLAYWFAKQSTTLRGEIWGTGLADRIDAILEKPVRTVTPENTVSAPLSADEYFRRNNPDFDDFRLLYPEETRRFFCKEEYVVFLQNQQFESEMINAPEAILVRFRKMATDDMKENRARELYNRQLAMQALPTARVNNDYKYQINNENCDMLIVQLRVIIQRLVIQLDYADYMNEVRDYLLQTLDNLAERGDFLQNFMELIDIVVAIRTFQSGDLTQANVDQFVKKINVTVMENFDVNRLRNRWAIVQLNRLLNERIHADTLVEDVLRVLKNNDDVKLCFAKHFVALDSELLAYLEKKVYSPKHLKDVLNLLLLLVDAVNYDGKFQAFENALFQCCKAMGSTGMKDYLQQRLNHAENLAFIYVTDLKLNRAIYLPEMRQRALITWLSRKNIDERQSLFAEFHGNTLFAWSERYDLLTDWITILKAGKALPFYQDYLDYLRQPDPDFPDCYCFETEFYPMLLHFYNINENVHETLRLDSVFFTEASTVLWFIVDGLFEHLRLPSSLHRYGIDVSPENQQAAIAQFRAIFRGYVLPPQETKASELEAVTFDHELHRSMHENFALNVSGRRRLMQAIRQMTYADFMQIIPESRSLKITIAALLEVFYWVPNHYGVVKRRLESALISQIEKALGEDDADHNALMDCLSQWLTSLQFKNFIECSPVINHAFCVFFQQKDDILNALRCETTLIPLILNKLRAVQQDNLSQKKAAYDYAYSLLRRVGIVKFDSLTIQSMREMGMDVSGFQFQEMDCNNDSALPPWQDDMRLLMSAQRTWNHFNEYYSSDTIAVLLERGFSNYTDNRFQFHMLIKWIATHKSEPDDISILMKHVITHLDSLQQACSIPREHRYFAKYVNAFFLGEANFHCDKECFDRLKLTLGHFVDMVQAANSVDEDKSVNTCMAVSGNLESAGAITEAQKAKKICDFLKQLSRNLMSNPALQQNIVDDDECLRLLGILFLEVPIGKSDVVKKEDYAAFINMRDLRNSVTRLHSFSRVIETLARQNPGIFKSTFAWWFARQSTKWTSLAVGTKLAARIETVIRDAETVITIAPEPAKNEPENIIPAREFFFKHNPDFESFQARYPETRDFFSKEDYVFFLQDQKFEEKMQHLELTSLEGIIKLHEMVCADEMKVRPLGDALYINYISPKRAEQLAHIFEKVAEKMPELTSIPTGASLSIVDYLIHKVHNLAKKEDVWLRHFKGLVEIAQAIIAYERDKNKETLISALNTAVETYKGTPSNTTSFLGKGIETNTMRDVYMAHLIARIGLMVDNDEKEGTEMQVIGSSKKK